jgi:competence ComEA-like helix-hairpin-helix protein
MALTEELIERMGGSTGAGVGAGLAALILAPRFARPLGRGLRSLAKGAIKGYLLVSERAREAVADASDELQQLYTEAQAEAGARAAGRNGHDAQAAQDLQGRAAPTETTRHVEGPPAEPRAPEPRPAEPRGAAAQPAPRAGETGRVNLNRADKELLMTLPGVGEKTAEKILQYRQEHGRIRSLDELHEADILFGHTAENLRDRVTT